MLADGVTKGVVGRAALHRSMVGTVTVNHEVKFVEVNGFSRVEHHTSKRVIISVDCTA